MPDRYPWYEVTDEPAILQGDMLRDCPILKPTMKVFCREAIPAAWEEDVRCQTYDVVVMSQPCDIVSEKVRLVLLCPYSRLGEMAEINPLLRRAEMREKVRRGEVFGYHMLNRCEFNEFHDDFLIVDFRNVYSLPLEFLKSFVLQTPRRLRLLPPYREHLSQAFARFFMRVGLPTEIPRFT